MTEDLQRKLKAVNRLVSVQEARASLLAFTKLMFPDIDDPENAKMTSYQVTPQARLLCELVEKVESGAKKRVAVSIGSQMGKSTILSKCGPAWIAGRNPNRHMILASYNQDKANEFGFELRNMVESAAYRQVFPEMELLKGGQSKDLLVTKQGGKLAFVGVGGSGTGKPADLVIVDDPFKGDEDASSDVLRERVWNWFHGTIMSRVRVGTGVIIVHTRWSQDDLIGRLCDMDHPERTALYKGFEKRWDYLNIPAVVQEPPLAAALGLSLEPPTDPDVVDQFGSRPMSSLWPEEFPLSLLAEKRHTNPRIFEAIYMGRPAPESGEYFKATSIVEYDAADLPKNLRKYGASDHAVSSKQRRDYTVLGCVGIDDDDDIWILPDLVWRRMETDQTVEELLQQFKIHRPALWWMESELISKSFGPFLRKRMIEEKIYTTVDPVVPSKDKETRARAIQGRMALQKVHFPRFAPWWQNAKTQILTFPYAANDDFVDWLAHIGMGLTKELKPSKMSEKDATLPPTGSIAWIMRNSLERARKGQRDKAAAGF